MDYQPFPPQNKNSSAGFYIALLIFLIILIVTGALLYLHYSKKETPPAEPPKFTMTIKVASDKAMPINTSYRITENSVLQQEGIIYGEQPEQFTKALNLSNYSVDVAANGHYKNSAVCNHFSDCVIELKKVGELKTEVMEFPNGRTLFLNVNNGSLRGVSLCISWVMGVFDVTYAGNLTTIPSRLLDDVDKCYDLGDLDEGYYVYSFAWVLEEERPGDAFTVWFVDDKGEDNSDNNAADYKQEIKIL